MVRWVSHSCSPSLCHLLSISSSATSTQKAAFSPSRTSSRRGSLRIMVPRDQDIPQKQRNVMGYTAST